MGREPLPQPLGGARPGSAPGPAAFCLGGEEPVEGRSKKKKKKKRRAGREPGSVKILTGWWQISPDRGEDRSASCSPRRARSGERRAERCGAAATRRATRGATRSSQKAAGEQPGAAPFAAARPAERRGECGGRPRGPCGAGSGDSAAPRRGRARGDPREAAGPSPAVPPGQVLHLKKY